MKKMYNQPTTEIIAFETEYMMQDLNVSVNGGSGSTDPHAGAPARRGTLIPD
ncbi:MAG: hypothetical protein IJQ20_07160 [Paludibacteraceae bacterium]|nr:hypothetical protein [Paludibacteraceae bacterium]